MTDRTTRSWVRFGRTPVKPFEYFEEEASPDEYPVLFPPKGRKTIRKRNQRQEKLEVDLSKDLAAEKHARAEWIPAEVHERMKKGTLQSMDTSDIKQDLLRGLLPCGWLPDGTWHEIHRRAQEHENTRLPEQQQVEILKQVRLALAQQRQELERELQRIKIQTEELDIRIQVQEKVVSSTPDYSSLVAFAALVLPIEQELVGKLEAELAKKKAQLASLDDGTSTQPKLSLLLNCMGIDANGIAATSSLDLAQFARKTRRADYFTEAHGSSISRNVVRDLLRCGELAREGSFVGHDDDCVVCANKTPEQLINLLKERGITLDGTVLRRQGINGSRVLFCTPKDFPLQPAKEVMKAIDALLALHEEHL